ncbi:hypothetical protein BRADI_5g17575v3 [Brachypodium distachyon]|uniref:Uncharacterized protein n=1 Tax=Brachypodium distachyon TaxID=15368 RepID=A0A0Q3H6V1_BRADI|nr:hypothetical protein BRADI_5g17575v3 [Brachypodium distachyon]
MLILELGACIIPMTLVFVPVRRLVLLVAKLQELEQCIMRPRAPLSPGMSSSHSHMSPEMWSRMSSLHTIGAGVMV